jgi:hypothetical protein
MSLIWEADGKGWRGYDDNGDRVGSVTHYPANPQLREGESWTANLYRHHHFVGEYKTPEAAMRAADEAFEAGVGVEPPPPPVPGRRLG